MKVYHGTSAYFRCNIEENGLVPQNHRTHVYVTTDYDRAKEYSMIWTGGLIREEERAIELGEKEGFFMDTYGIIVSLDVPEEMLKLDDYNLEGEPDQFKVLGGLDESHIVNIEDVYFREYSDDIDEETYQSNLISAAAKLVGVSQWGED